MLCLFQMNISERIILDPQEQATIRLWAHGKSFPLRLVQRAQIIQMAADGIFSHDIACRLGISRPTVQLWRQRFLSFRCAGLEKDAPRPGRIPKISNAKIKAVVKATIETTPPHATHWSTRTMAKAQGLSEATIRRIWKQHNLKPHLVKTFKLSRDKHFVEKLYDIVGLYLNPPDKSLVLCVDEKSQIQGSGQDPAGSAAKERPVRNDDSRLQTQRHDHLVCGLKYAGRQSYRRLHAASSTPGVYPFPQANRWRNPLRTGSSFDCRQLRYPQTSAGEVLAQTASPVQSTLYTNFQFLVKSSRTLVSRDHRQTDTTRFFSKRLSLDQSYQRLPGKSQPKSKDFRLERSGGAYFGEDRQM